MILEGEIFGKLKLPIHSNHWLSIATGLLTYIFFHIFHYKFKTYNILNYHLCQEK